MRAIGNLLVTGVPGWLTDALLRSLANDPPAGLTSVRCVAIPGAQLDADILKTRTGIDAQIVFCDMRNQAGLVRLTEGVDTVLHAAAILHVRRIRDWYDINSEGTRMLAEAAVGAGCNRFVHISSNAAGGRSTSRDRLLIEADPARPKSHYGRSKLLAEQALELLASGMETVNLRPCMFYGPPVPERHVDIYRRILAGRMPMVGSGDYARSVVHMDNLIQMCRLAMTHPAAAGQTYYVADRRPYTTRQVVEAMADALGKTPSFWGLPAFMAPLAYAGDMTLAALGLYWQTLHLVGESDWHVGVSVDKAVRELGYHPTRELAEGMREAVSWCKSRGLLPSQDIGE